MSSFLRRWSERKSREAEPSPAPEPLVEPAPATDTPPPPSDTPGELAAKIAALPALEEIGADTDIRPFLQDFVPAALRKAAMRRAWSADPIISTHLDVARDYAWEFNTGEMPVGFARSLAPDAVQKSLDSIGEIGRKISNALEGTAAKAAPPPSDPSERADDATALVAEVAQDPKNSPDLSEPEEKSLPSSLILQQRHGSALPS